MHGGRDLLIASHLRLLAGNIASMGRLAELNLRSHCAWERDTIRTGGTFGKMSGYK